MLIIDDLACLLEKCDESSMALFETKFGLSQILKEKSCNYTASPGRIPFNT